MGVFEDVFSCFFPKKRKEYPKFTSEEVRLIEIAEKRALNLRSLSRSIQCTFAYIEDKDPQSKKVVLGNYFSEISRTTNLVVRDNITINRILVDLAIDKETRLLVLAHELGHLLLSRENPVLEFDQSFFIKESMANVRGWELLRELGEPELANRLLKMPAGEIKTDIK
jgi:hypothetical protein